MSEVGTTIILFISKLLRLGCRKKGVRVRGKESSEIPTKVFAQREVTSAEITLGNSVAKISQTETIPKISKRTQTLIASTSGTIVWAIIAVYFIFAEDVKRTIRAKLVLISLCASLVLPSGRVFTQNWGAWALSSGRRTIWAGIARDFGDGDSAGGADGVREAMREVRETKIEHPKITRVSLI